MNFARRDALATRLLAAFDEGAPLAPITADDPSFDVAAAYEVLAEIDRRRRERGWQAVGRKIGFTNRGLWARYDVDRPMCAQVWRETLVDAPSGAASFALDRAREPRIEPEVVFGLRRALPSGADARTVLAAVEWIAPGFEIVDSPFPGWKFRAPDCTAAFGLHRALVVGPRLALDERRRDEFATRLPSFVLTLRRDGAPVEEGVGRNVLDSPALALGHLAQLLATQRAMPPLAAGELVTTGTLTDAWPVRAGETWTSDYDDLGVAGISLRFS
ncbi:MAG: decarboxylase [Burkholderiales bacterium]|nr:decarboxylase [Burkholderiales bacterium]